MKYVSLVIAAVSLSACGKSIPEIPGANLLPQGGSSGASAPVAPAAPATLNLTGHWRHVGDYCGATYTPLGYTQYADFTATEMSVSMMTSCGSIMPVQYFELRYNATSIDIRLDRAFDTCPSNYAASPSSPWQTKPVTVSADGLYMEMTNGTCSPGNAAKSAYQKQ